MAGHHVSPRCCDVLAMCGLPHGSNAYAKDKLTLKKEIC
jgi:hypothetical protein